MDTTAKEMQGYEHILCDHLYQMSYFLRHIPEARWDWTPAVCAPTPRILAAHAWQWLICDRYHIREADARKHPGVPEPPRDPADMCDALDQERENWRQMLRGLSATDLDAPRHQFNQSQATMTVRGFVLHMVQNTIYKSGQLATLYFALGLDGTEPYDAPFPNPVYEEVFGPRSNRPSGAAIDH